MIIVALIGAVIMGMLAITVDQGIGLADRRDLQADADSAALAGAREYSTGGDSNTAHRTALRYVARALNATITFPLSGTSGGSGVSCASTGSCPAGTYTVVTNYSVALTDSGATTLDVSISHTRRTVIAGVLGFSTSVIGSGGRAVAGGVTIHAATYALATELGDAAIHGGGTSSPTGTVSGPVYAKGNFGANNGPHAPPVTASTVNYDGTSCSPGTRNHVDLGSSSNGLQYSWQATPLQVTGVENDSTNLVDPFGGSSPAPPAGVVFTSTVAAKDASGNWKPGTYSGIFPSGGKLNPGVYKITGVSATINLGSIANLTYTAAGTSDTSGAVALVVDATDTGDLDVSSAILNGIDDLNGASAAGTRDPEGTHNFVIYGGGPTPYLGSISIGPGSTTNLSGLTYLPKTSVSTIGNASVQFTGAAYLGSFSVSGGGNGTQSVAYVCGIGTVSGTGGQSGLTR